MIHHPTFPAHFAVAWLDFVGIVNLPRQGRNNNACDCQDKDDGPQCFLLSPI
jgi:hypothetical protein